MKRSARGLAVAFGLGIGVFVHSGVGWAQDTVDSAAEARQQYQDGTKAFSAKRYSEAALHFEAAASFKANAVALYTAALAWDLASRPERAADAYARALEVPGLDTKQTNVARDRVATLEKTLGTLLVTAPEGYKVQLDNLTEVVTPARLHSSPGAHVLNIRTASKGIERRDVSLDSGRVTNLELKEEPKPPPPRPPADTEPVREKPQPPPPPQGEALPARLREPFWTNLRVAGVGVGGLGIAALGAGIILGTSAEGAKEAYDAAPSRAGFDHASSLETWTNVVFITGGVLVAGGIALLVIPVGERNEGRFRASATPGGLVLDGTF